MTIIEKLECLPCLHQKLSEPFMHKFETRVKIKLLTKYDVAIHVLTFTALYYDAIEV